MIAVRMVKDHYAQLNGDELFAVTIRENVLAQLDHLKTHPAVATRLRRGDLRLHGWVYSIGKGEEWMHDAEKKDFVHPSKRKQKTR
jgi:carbonic anhydrase